MKIEEILKNPKKTEDLIRDNLKELESIAFTRPDMVNQVYLGVDEDGYLEFYFAQIPVNVKAISRFKSEDLLSLVLLSDEMDLCESDFAINILQNTEDKKGAQAIWEFVEKNPCAWCLTSEECRKVYDEEKADYGEYINLRREIIIKIRALTDYYVFLDKELEKENDYSMLADDIFPDI